VAPVIDSRIITLSIHEDEDGSEEDQEDPLASLLSAHIAPVRENISNLESNQAKNGCGCSNAEGHWVQDCREQVSTNASDHVEESHFQEADTVLDS